MSTVAIPESTKPVRSTTTVEERTDTRDTFEEAVNKIGRHMKELVEQGSEDRNAFRDASRADRLEAEVFFKKFAEDLSLVCGRKCSVPPGMVEGLRWHDDDHEWFVGKFKTIVREVVQRLKCHQIVKINFLGFPFNFPASVVDWKEDQVAVFQAIAPENEKVVKEYKLAEASLKHPEDFTRSVPRAATKKLGLLQKTHFNYTPKILDGLLTEETTLNRRNALTHIHHYLQDPALVMQAGEFGDIAVHYWKEEKRSLIRPIQRLVGKVYRNYALRTLLIAMVVLFFVSLVFQAATWFAVIGRMMYTLCAAIFLWVYAKSAYEMTHQRWRL